MHFNEFGFQDKIIQAVTECGYTEPTPIQEKAIPHILRGADVIGLAQTGTGKTAGFILPMLEILSGGRAKSRMPRSLVLAPTRELAAQVAENFDEYGKHLKLSKALLTGGTSMADQMKMLDRGVDVLIATPGRLLDLFGRGSILLTDVKVLVVDEADRMLDMGFIPDIDKIISLLPPRRQTLLFSATMAPEIQKLAEKYMFSPVEVSVAVRSAAAETVVQKLVVTDSRRKRRALEDIIAQEDIRNAFIFMNRKRDVPKVCDWLKKGGHNVAPLHGDMAQSERNAMLERFKSGEARFMVCSDVAARGLDVQAVSHVINFDVPMNAEDYVHRIGRTGRAGLDGQAWTIATPEEDKYIQAIEKIIGRPLPRAETHKVSEKSEADRPKAPVRRESKKHSGKPRRRYEAEEDEDVVGFGDDMPAFFKAGQ